jgi:hypothetical protein
MKPIIIISQCISISKHNSSEAEFNFKGFYAGHLLKKLKLEISDNQTWSLNEEYVMYVKIINIEESTLFGKVIKLKNLKDFSLY